MFGLEPVFFFLLIVCIVCVLAFEFINGFHDTANAVATVIYTNSLKPVPAVIWSGIWNGIGVLLGGVGVAYGIVKLLPMDAILDQSMAQNSVLIISMLLSAIIWNLGTWYFGIPASSSHTLIGSLIGVGIGMSVHSQEGFGHGVNWQKAADIGISLLVSPMLGFSITIIIMFLIKIFFKKQKVLFKEANTKKKPPFLVRSILILTCTGVSFSHGNNDGQKGIGLAMIILICFAPAYFLINPEIKPEKLNGDVVVVESIINKIDTNRLAIDEKGILLQTKEEIKYFKTELAVAGMNQLSVDVKREARHKLNKFFKNTKEILSEPNYGLSSSDKTIMKESLENIKSVHEYAPFWMVLLISLSLGIGTMVGWKRIVKTIGEKIGKQHLSYAQGASAELVAASTIFLASYLKLPVSTTHVLSSGIAGSMVASGGIKNLQAKTIKTIAMAWILTLPVTVTLSAVLYLLFSLFV
jgi:PiT family inorganic phosphate transporter